MKTRVGLALLIAIYGATALPGAISRTGSGNGTTSFTLSGTAATDSQLGFSYRSGSTTPPSLPAGWVNIPCASSCATSAGGTTGSFRLACRMSATTTSGTFTNGNDSVGVSYAGVNNAASTNCGVVGVTILVAGNQNTAKTSTTVTYNSIPIQSTNDWFVAFQGGSAGSTCTASDATAVTNLGDAAVSDSNGTVSSKSATTCSVTSETWMTVVVELQGQPNTCSGTCANLNYIFSNAHCGENCNNIKIPWSGATGTGTLAGNLLIVAASYPNASTVSSIVDNQSSSYTSTQSTDAGTGGKVLNVYYVPNTAAGITSITFNFGSAVADFHAEVMEFSNIATSTPADGSCQGTIAVPATSAFPCASSFTPSTSGDLIVYCMESTDTGTGMGTSNVVSSIYPGFPFALMSANQEFGSGCQYWQQPTAAAITPFMVVTQATHDNMISVGAAFKTASAGNAATGMRLVHQATQHLYQAASTINFPCTGNLIVITSDDSDNNSGGDVVTISGTSPSNTFTKLAPSQAVSGDNEMFYAVNATCSTNFQLTLNSGQFTDTTLVHLYDVAGAATSPHDVDSSTTNGNQSGTSNVTSAPSITPTVQPGMIFAAIGFGSGPTSGTTSGNCLYDNSPYTGETDASLMDNGNGFCHGFYTSTSAIAVGWTMNNSPGGSAWFAVGSTFKAAAGGSSFTGSTVDNLLTSNPASGQGAHFAASNNLGYFVSLVSVFAAHLGVGGDVLNTFASTIQFAAHNTSSSDLLSWISTPSSQAAHFGTTADLMTLRDLPSSFGAHIGQALEFLTLSILPAGIGSHFGANLDLIAFADSPRGLGSHFGAPSDYLSLLDFRSSASGRGRNVADSLTFSDLPSGFGAHLGSTSDRLPLASLISAQAGRFGVVADSLRLSDTNSDRGAHFAQPADYISTSDFAAGHGAHLATISDLIRGLDFGAPTHNTSVLVSELFNLRESNSRVGAFHLSSADVIGAGDSAGRIAAHIAASADMALVSETRNLGRSVNAMEALVMMDSSARLAHYSLTSLEHGFHGEIAVGLRTGASGQHFFVSVSEFGIVRDLTRLRKIDSANIAHYPGKLATPQYPAAQKAVF